MATKNIAPSMQIQASRGTNEQSVVFGDLKPWKNTWLVHVKVLHAWKQYIQSVETMEFVLADETGQKIHATCKRTYIESKGRILTVGAWRYIRNFQITPAGGAYRTTDHTWKIVFNQNTVVTRSNHVDELYLNLSDSQSVLSGTLDENFLIDVLGQVMDCGDVENIQCTGGKQRKKLEFTLSDINDSRLLKLGGFRGELQISNAFDASQMMINPSIPEAEAFKELINDDDKTLTSFQSNEDSQEDNNKQVDQSGKRGQRDKWLLFPTKNIQEMITSTQVSCY
ncbi:BnaA06g38860D [Brassica napus]|uniref:BnaA06g38860D protein n=2 Tax=Brassica napus TaxID=3708 RepID=A0A078IY46_BRANA|nr:BnaA06g38860D [Brassica napus]